LLAGQGVGLVNAVEPAATVIGAMTEQARAMLDRYRDQAPGSPGAIR
jgi:NAD(P)H-dependent flavin oxidoreductase YrpB (nitropropane dioxygenase family)